MAIDLITKFSVVEKTTAAESKEVFEAFLAPQEEILLTYKNTRDRVAFTNQKIICYDVQGMTGTKKEYRFFPYSKISSFSIETAGLMDSDDDFKIWVSGVGRFEIKFSKKLNTQEIGVLLSSKIL